MWHEARKQEKALRGIMVNFQKRAERRREFYDKMRSDPMKFLRIFGQSAKIHMDPVIAAAGDSPSTMMPWAGDPNVTISRFDVRAHLDYLPPQSSDDDELSREAETEEMRCNYERYRTLVQNSFTGTSEDQCLKNIDLKELFPEKTVKNKDKAKLAGSRAAIGFSYEGSSVVTNPVHDNEDVSDDGSDSSDKLFTSESEYEIDMDVDKLNRAEIDKLNLCALEYGVVGGFFSKSLRREKEKLLELKEARLQELEKSSLHGKKSRKERKLIKELRMIRRIRRHSPRSYSIRGSPTYEDFKPEGRRSSDSHSSSPELEPKIEFITSFGGESEEEKKTKTGSSHVSHVVAAGKEVKTRSEPQKTTKRTHSLSDSRSSNQKSNRKRIHHRSRSRSRSRSSSRERTSRHHGDRYHSLSSSSRYTQHSRGRRHLRSRSPSKSPVRSRRFRSRSRSRSRDRRSLHHSHRRRSSSSSTSSSSSSKPRSRSRTPPHRRYRRQSTRSESPEEERMPSKEKPSKEKPSKPIEKREEKSLPVVKDKSKDKSKLTPQERLQRRLQLQLSKQVKLDRQKAKSKLQETRSRRN